MPGDDGAPIIVRSYDLCAALYEHVNRFPRAQRTLLGRRVLDESLQMLSALTLANRLTDKGQALSEASGHLDALRICLRLANRLGFLPNAGYGHLSSAIDEVGRMLGGWIKHERVRDREPSETGKAVGTPPSAALLTAHSPETPGAKPARARSSSGGKGAVRYTMRSPLVERYLHAKLAHPDAIVLVRSGAFFQAFFEDAQLLGRRLGVRVRNMAADGEREKIFACGIPKASLESALERLGRAGSEVHVE